MWFPMAPSVASADDVDGFAVAKAPVRKKVAGTCSRDSVAMIDAAPWLPLPASNVKAITLLLVLRRDTTRPVVIGGGPVVVDFGDLEGVGGDVDRDVDWGVG